ncbi:MAG: methyltransferase domain-containing protein [Candidatus Shapirobacteria bacterium]
MIKINLGCGPLARNNWTNIDYGLLPLLGKCGLTKVAGWFGLIDKNYVTVWPKFKYFDIRHRLPFENSCVNYIYCSHVLEHFEKNEVFKILSECRRVLKKGGVVRIVLPDLKKLIDSYDGSDLFCREFYGYDKDLIFGFWGNIKKLFIRGHQWMYGQDEFVNLLKEVGFKKVNVVSYRKGVCPDIDKLDLEVHLRLSFYVEASS